ncbi:calcium/sodium antiporter [Flavobacteriaceae bacterium]|jgi:cation:H+ antiporter|nr:calcium/sodium antiporter [Flavobacteriaceae bacterium]
MSFLWVILGFILLVIGGEFLVKASVSLSFKLSISKFVIGMTVVSFATSVPELLVSLNAALNGSPAIAINNVIGSNIANIGLVLGITAIVGSISVSKTFYQLNWPSMMLFSIVLYYFLSNDNKLIFNEGLILFSMLLLFLFLLLRQAKKEAYLDEVNEALAVVSFFRIVVWLLIGGVALYFGSLWLVKGAIDLAQIFGVSEAVISISVIAVGTSVPELAASVIAAARQEKSISLGNLIGSNIFNIGSVLGVTSMIKTIEVTEPEILTRDIFWMIAFSAALVPLILIPKKHQISRINGFVLTISYGFFLLFIFS